MGRPAAKRDGLPAVTCLALGRLAQPPSAARSVPRISASTLPDATEDTPVADSHRIALSKLKHGG